jgi:phosphoribosylformylglycinamidine cyclo-ligase
MLRTFNNGVGMIAVVPEKSAQEVIDRLSGMNEKAWIIGEVTQSGKTDKNRFRWSCA